jgi:hypothetical protein
MIRKFNINLFHYGGITDLNNCCWGMYTGVNDNEEFHSFTPLNFLEEYNNQEMIELLSEQLKIK